MAFSSLNAAKNEAGTAKKWDHSDKISASCDIKKV